MLVLFAQQPQSRRRNQRICYQKLAGETSTTPHELLTLLLWNFRSVSACVIATFTVAAALCDGDVLLRPESYITSYVVIGKQYFPDDPIDNKSHIVVSVDQRT